MAENLNVGNRIDADIDQTDNQILEKYCYDNLETNCDTYGGLYQWNETMQYTTTPGVTGICPEGWHVPTDSEWYNMENFIDPTIDDPLQKDWRGVDCGTKLKIGGSSGFEAMMAGWRYHNADFLYLGTRTIFWTSTENNIRAWFRILYDSDPRSFRNETMKSHGNSIRCLRDAKSNEE